ncbi:uncharacterized protein BT62DRAFT_186612 [Guyanagaster necrorhizus]|uniref:Transmembrane protein n=1 Tax=Guyanagaster necrorhizus TaxID=856835 RepID=A0A9P8ARJ7_9AGAR|nr:uncharacterized protein BT62DRAFT_186612 [Guyanagaster necrorhizus MCA 3950]KAG7445264.1 hypothetical protein BT62DRAFT_186612 [Guyanagaster necrorhizus MCA 3950]
MKLGRVSITLGVVFFAACLIEIFGIVSSVTRQLTLVRIYVDLAFLSAVLLAAVGVLDAIAYFAFADDIIEECISLSSRGALDVKSLFRGSAWPRQPILYVEDAQRQCVNAWSKHASSEVLSILFFYLLPSTFSYLLAYTYHRRMPAPRNRRREPIRMERFVNGNSTSQSPVYNTKSDDSPSGSERPKKSGGRGVPLASPVKGSRWTDSSTVSLSPGPPSYGTVGNYFRLHDVQLSANCAE